MASIRKRDSKWQVQVRRQGQNSQSRSFVSKSDAQQWAREIEVRADNGNLSTDLSLLRTTNISDDLSPKNSCILW